MKKIILLLTICFLLFACFLPAYAQTGIPLTVAPARQELIVDPGEKTAINIKFFNRGETPVSGLLDVADFIVDDKEGTPVFLEEGTPTVTGVTQISPRFSAASWVALPYDRITIASKGKVLIQARITVPLDARPGGRYFAIYFEPGGIPGEGIGTPKEAATPVAARIAGLVYLRVSGPITEEARVVQFTAPRFSEYGPISVTTEILNLGNYHIRPQGVIKLTNLFGQTVDEQLLNEQNIFPDASRIYTNGLGGKWLFGKYKLELVASYGEAGQVLTVTVFAWVFPWKAIAIVVLTIAVAVLLASILWRRLKKREEELEEKVEELEKKIEEKK